MYPALPPFGNLRAPSHSDYPQQPLSRKVFKNPFRYAPIIVEFFYMCKRRMGTQTRFEVASKACKEQWSLSLPMCRKIHHSLKLWPHLLGYCTTYFLEFLTWCRAMRTVSISVKSFAASIFSIYSGFSYPHSKDHTLLLREMYTSYLSST
jgi:hypothetical protein